MIFFHEDHKRGPQDAEKKEQEDFATPPARGPKLKTSIIKGVLVACFFLLVIYLIYYSAHYGKANFILSSQDVTTDSAPQVVRYKVQDRVYFYINRNNTELNSTLLVIEVEFFEGNAYKPYKQIRFDLEKDFPKLSSYIPGEYFRRAGRYKVKASLDGKNVSENEIEITE